MTPEKRNDVEDANMLIHTLLDGIDEKLPHAERVALAFERMPQKVRDAIVRVKLDRMAQPDARETWRAWKAKHRVRSTKIVLSSEQFNAMVKR